MIKVALFVRLEAKPGKAVEVENFLRGGLPLVEQEPATLAWFGIRLGPTTFGIFDAFPDEFGPAGASLGKSRGRLDGQSAGAARATTGHREGRGPCSQTPCISWIHRLRTRTQCEAT